MLGVLEVILRQDPVAGAGFSVGQRQIVLIIFSRVLRRPGDGLAER